MDVNPYSPPQSAIGEMAPVDNRPALWNPNAAASWSLLFTPIFGAWLHMKNWQAMGEHEKARSSKMWIFATIAVLALSLALAALLPDSRGADGIGRLIGFVILIAWYVGSARPQTKYVLERYGEHYVRKGWGKPLLFGVLGIIGFLVAAVAIGVLTALMFGDAG